AKEGDTMCARKMMAVFMLSLAPTFAFADKDCSKIDNEHKRQECREEKVEDAKDDVDCDKLDNGNARRECRQHKYGVNNRAECRKLDSPALRSACFAAKGD